MTTTTDLKVPASTTWVEYMRLDDLLGRHHPDNPKDHDIGGIIEALEEFGFVRNVMINETDGLLLFGHGTTRALDQMHAKKMKPPERIVADDSGDWWVPVDRGLKMSKRKAKGYVIADNQHAMAGGWNEPLLCDRLIELAKSDGGLRGTGFNGDDVDALIAIHRKDLLAGLEDPGARKMDHDTLLEKWKVEVGQVWEIGRGHRILCGDSTRSDHLDVLMGSRKAQMVWTDPPFAVYGTSTGVSADVADDRMIRPFFRDVLVACRERTEKKAHIYICCDWRSWSTIWDMARVARVAVKNCIVWDKITPGMGNMYRGQHEFLMFIVNDFQETVLGPKHTTVYTRQVGAPNVWQIERVESARKAHNAQKPTEYAKRAIHFSSDEGGLVLDLFLGTGTTMAAAEEIGRVCYGVEIDPRFVAVSLQRAADAGMECRQRRDLPKITA